jgi:hypothetical protein
MKKNILKNKYGQEEMIGFALIIIMVAVILLIFLSFSLRGGQKEIVESYEVESFLAALMQYTSDCEDNLEYLPIRKLIFDCEDNKMCLDERNTCDALNSTLTDIIKESWKVEGDRPVKGYEFKIIINGEEMLLLKEGNITKNYKGAIQDFSKSSGKDYEFFFTAYY